MRMTFQLCKLSTNCIKERQSLKKKNFVRPYKEKRGFNYG